MTESKKRKFHPPEFKAKVGLEALAGMKTINQIAQEYGVHPMQVGQWQRDIQAQAKSLFEGKRGPQPVSAESDSGVHFRPEFAVVASFPGCLFMRSIELA